MTIIAQPITEQVTEQESSAEAWARMARLSTEAAAHRQAAQRLYTERDEIARDLLDQGCTVVALARVCGTSSQAMGYATGRWKRHPAKPKQR